MEGLLMKYFVVNPNKRDWHGDASRAAIRAYAASVEAANPLLSSDLKAWLKRLEPDPGNTPRIGAHWPEQGGTYAGVVRGDDGQPDYYLILHDDDTSLPWEKAVAWAKERKSGAHADFSLPKRKEQAILFGNLKNLFQETYYWSGEQYASASDYAWSQYFGNGTQTGDPKDDELRARAVRRLPIE
jgi:hypothetical protein